MAYETLVHDADAEEAGWLAALVAAAGAERLDVRPSCDRDELARALSAGGADIVVMGLRVPVSDELALVRRCLGKGGHAQVVYVGGRDAFTSEVYAAPHVGFLLRPVSGRELDAALARALARLAAWRDRPVLVRTPGGDERAISPRRVSHVESARRLLRIHMGAEVLEAYGKKSDLIGLLPESFVQCHRSHLVNLRCVGTLGGHSVTLTTGEVVPVSRERLERTRAAYQSYVGRAL